MSMTVTSLHGNTANGRTVQVDRVGPNILSTSTSSPLDGVVTGDGTSIGAAVLDGLTFDGPSRVLKANGGALTTATDGATVTFDLSVSRRQIVTLGGNRTLALSNDEDDDPFTIILKQDGGGNRTVTWWAGIKWPGGTAPTLTTTGGKYDVFAFLRIAAGEYLGFAGSLNH